MSNIEPRFSKPAAFFWLFRPNRTIMVALITGAAAFTAGTGYSRSLWMTLAGWLLAVGGFSLDLYADRDLDVEGTRSKIRRNPMADGSLPPVAGLIFSLSFIAASLVVTLLVTPWGLLPWIGVMVVVMGLALHIFETPLARALTLGLLQALYLLMGASAGQLSAGLGFMAGTFFFAMFGGRGMTDIRDFPQDRLTRVQTLPKKYGVKRTAWFTGICLVISYALSFGAYLTGEFNVIYLYLDLVFIAVGLVCAWLFVRRPSPELAYTLTLIFMMGTGFVITLAMVLGSI
jgi:4-hydroxybenzoate polyprenyltransferase